LVNSKFLANRPKHLFKIVLGAHLRFQLHLLGEFNHLARNPPAHPSDFQTSFFVPIWEVEPHDLSDLFGRVHGKRDFGEPGIEGVEQQAPVGRRDDPTNAVTEGGPFFLSDQGTVLGFGCLEQALDDVVFQGVNLIDKDDHRGQAKGPILAFNRVQLHRVVADLGMIADLGNFIQNIVDATDPLGLDHHQGQPDHFGEQFDQGGLAGRWWSDDRERKVAAAMIFPLHGGKRRSGEDSQGFLVPDEPGQRIVAVFRVHVGASLVGCHRSKLPVKLSHVHLLTRRCGNPVHTPAGSSP
jgi:hypothetical protein